MRTYRQTDTTKLTISFRNFANPPKMQAFWNTKLYQVFNSYRRFTEQQYFLHQGQSVREQKLLTSSIYSGHDVMYQKTRITAIRTPNSAYYEYFHIKVFITSRPSHIRQIMYVYHLQACNRVTDFYNTPPKFSKMQKSEHVFNKAISIAGSLQLRMGEEA